VVHRYLCGRSSSTPNVSRGQVPETPGEPRPARETSVPCGGGGDDPRRARAAARLLWADAGAGPILDARGGVKTSYPRQPRLRHIVSLSGGKDSSALAIYLRERIPGLEYVFCDTGEELPETYEYLERLQTFLGKPIVRLRAHGKTLRDLIEQKGGFLPSPRARWCTRLLKIEPFERYVGADHVYLYIALRADERGRKGFIPRTPNIVPRYPFIEAGISNDDVVRMLEQSGLGLPAFYQWRSRSGCYCCFFQQRIEWVGLLEHHPDLFWRAAQYERYDEATGRRYTWGEYESLEELARPDRIEEIRREHALRLQLLEQKRAELANRPTCNDSDASVGCAFCHL